jgi:hypothetical protein
MVNKFLQVRYLPTTRQFFDGNGYQFGIFFRNQFRGATAVNDMAQVSIPRDDGNISRPSSSGRIIFTEPLNRIGFSRYNHRSHEVILPGFHKVAYLLGTSSKLK